MGKIYTKSGDNGTTSLIGGRKILKCHSRVETYGTVDELNSFIGLLRDQQIDNYSKKILIKIQEKLMLIAVELASDSGKKIKKNISLKKNDILFLEKEIDKIEIILPPLKSFVLPGGHPAVSFCHVARTVCRRAERVIVALSQEEKINSFILIYMNLLSDYLFVLARKLAIDFNAEEILFDSAAQL